MKTFGMFVAMIDVSLSNGTEEEFSRHVKETNAILFKIDGFVSRRLLRSHDGSYRILVEHKTRETFEAMHKNPEHDKVRAKLFEFIDPKIQKSLYTVISE